MPDLFVRKTDVTLISPEPIFGDLSHKDFLKSDLNRKDAGSNHLKSSIGSFNYTVLDDTIALKQISENNFSEGFSVFREKYDLKIKEFSEIKELQNRLIYDENKTAAKKNPLKGFLIIIFTVLVTYIFSAKSPSTPMAKHGVTFLLIFAVIVVFAILGSGLVDQSQKMTVAASAMAEKKTVGHRS